MDHPKVRPPACDVPWYPPIDVPHPYLASLNYVLAIPLTRDILLGALIPAWLVLTRAIALRYLRWLTERSDDTTS